MDELSTPVILNIINNIWWDRNTFSFENKEVHVEFILRRIQISIVNFNYTKTLIYKGSLGKRKSVENEKIHIYKETDIKYETNNVKILPDVVANKEDYWNNDNTKIQCQSHIITHKPHKTDKGKSHVNLNYKNNINNLYKVNSIPCRDKIINA